MNSGTPRTLSSDIHQLGDLLGQTIRRLAGEEAFELIEAVRGAAKDLRAAPSIDEARRLLDRLASLPLPLIRTLIRAFRVYFDLINLAEQQARVRALRQRRQKCHPEPIAESPEEALLRLRGRGVTAEQCDSYLRRAAIVPVFTAHPTEARRRTVLEKLGRIAAELDRLERVDPRSRERDDALAAIAEEVETLWLTETVRAARPTVLDEVRQMLDVVAPSLFGVVPRLYREFEAALGRVYPGHAATVPSFLRFGSWIGGDRDVNPFVSPEVTVETLRIQQEVVLEHYLERLGDLGRRLSHSARLAPMGPELLPAPERGASLAPEVSTRPESEPLRRACGDIAARVCRTLEHSRAVQPRWGGPVPAPKTDVYRGRDDLLRDVSRLAEGLRQMGATAAASGVVQDLIRLVDVFGLHLLTLDVRQHSARHAAAMAEVLRWAGVCPDYAGLSPEGRFDRLARELEGRRPLIPAHLPYSEPTVEVVETFRRIGAILEQQAPEAIDTYIISMTKEPAHLLEVLLLAREAHLFRPDEGVSRLNVVPLFETLEELRRAPQIMGELFALPAYRHHLRLRGDLQEVMIGYSDSNKESGFLQSVWALYKAERELTEAARPLGITVTIFHGRGGAIGRGGGPANRAILAQPRGTIDGRMRVTEQGEVIADRYGHPAIAERHLGQVIHAVLVASFPTAGEQPDPRWESILDRLAAAACRHYRALVFETPEFLTYFEQATPLSEIARLRIGSRPARRGGSWGVEDLRAIPWVFSWMQSRHTLPGWYGLGGALEEYLAAEPEGLATLREMYRRWPFWRTTLDNAQMILAKADMTIARLYAELVEDRALADRVFGRIEAEYRRTVEFVNQVTDHRVLLEDRPVLQRSIRRRNPYVDPLSFIQLELLRRLRSGGEDDEELLAGVLESISGIAAGLKNTG